MMPSSSGESVRAPNFAETEFRRGFAPGKWSVSHFNFEERVRQSMNLPRRVELMDMTLSRGVQLPGVGYLPADEVAIAQALSESGVPQISAWYFGGEPFDARTLTTLGLSSKISCVLSLGSMSPIEEQIDVSADAGVDFVEAGFQPLPGRDIDDLCVRIRDVVGYAKRRGIEVRVDCGDAGWGELEAVLRICWSAYDAGADYIALTDHNTLGPSALRFLVAEVKKSIPGGTIGVHTHNMAGLAVAASLAAVEAGAEFIDVSVNAMGGTGGQADLAQVAVALEAYYGVDTGIELQSLAALYQTVEQVSGYPISWLSPLIGPHSHAEMGAALERADPYLTNAILPDATGSDILRSPTLLMDDEGIRTKLIHLGFSPSPALVSQVARAVKDLIRTEKTIVTDQMFESIANDHLHGHSTTARKAGRWT
jgi:2-isopropylmalate synthase